HFAEHLGRCIYDGFWVAEDASIPNQDRIRLDVVAALKELDIPNLRWPGGCFADEYHWQDGIGPPEARPTMINTNWGGVTEDNSFGTHEFLQLCQLLGAEPVICGNLGSGTVQEMSQWVEYLNSNNLSPMTKLRKKNGQEEPFKVKYFGVGNENWGCGGQMTAEFYTHQMRRYSTFLKNYGPNELYRIACGASRANYGWTETVMRDGRPGKKGGFQGLSLHYYTTRVRAEGGRNRGDALEFDEFEWHQTFAKTLVMDELIQKHGAIMDQYDPEQKIGLIVDEWGTWWEASPGTNPRFLYQQNTIRDALVAGLNLDIFNNHCDRVHMANLAQTVNVLQAMVLTQGEQMVKTPSFYVFKMYKVHHDATLIPHRINSNPYTYQDQVIEAVHTSCSLDDQDKFHVTLTNLHPSNPQTVRCSFDQLEDLRGLRGEVITATALNAFNDFGQPEQVNIQTFSDFEVENNQVEVVLPPRSLVMIELMEN
ncbi:MAG: alpha-L-arabinofuranosidase C-terminal domain-containing protein, partial [Bacteroidota bacterium]